MLNDFRISFQVKNAYTVNEFIYGLQRIPFIGKFIPDSLYKMKFFKILSFIITFIREIIKIFGFKLLYIAAFLILPLSLYKSNSYEFFMHIYLFLAIIGSFSNTEIFNPTRDKYYMIVLMKMNARNHTISNFLYFLGSTFIGQLTAMLLLAHNIVPWYFILLLVILTIMLKFIAINFYFYRMKIKGQVINENKPESWTLYFGLMAVLLGLAYGLPYFNIVIPNYLFLILSIIILILGLISIKRIFKYPNYTKLYKNLLNPDNVFVNSTDAQRNTIVASNLKQISIDTTITSNKEGFAYFHDLFVKRHRKILSDSAKKTTLGILLAGIILLFVLFIVPESKEVINNFILNYLPFILLLMYFLNTGKVVTNAMFMNCDHSMLSYRFYRQPSTLLSLFKERLKTLIILNLIPALTMSLIISILLAVSGGASFITYIVVFFSIVAMSIFFSVHNLILYYLLQPYNIGMEMKSTTYTIISIATYWLCYYISDLKVSSFTFGIIMILFAIIYSLISLFLVYRYAPKTFRLR